MATDDERREVAAKLRELPDDMCEVESLWEAEAIETECHDQTDYYQLHSALLGCLPAEHMHPCDYGELHKRLADLIEPAPERTCRMVFDMVAGMHRCSECGTYRVQAAYGIERGEWSYCPNCGAKAVVG